MARYTVDILDNNGQRIGFIPAPVSPSYRRRHNQATSFSFGVLLDHDVAPLLTYGTRCILRREGVERVAGTITRRDVSGQVMRVECITSEALLRDIITPADWNYWAGWELGDAVRDLLMDFEIQARNTPEDWAAAIEKVDVDLTTMPGKVVLAKGSTGRYKSHGYITLQFDFGLISKYQALRWSEECGQRAQVRAKMQFRTSANGTSWSAWSQELQSVFPSEDGVALTGSERYIQIRMHLYTDNTSEKDQNGVPTGYTPVLNGVEVIARKLGPVTEGGIEATPDVTIPAYRSENEDQKETYSFNRENALRILQTWCEDFGYEFRVDGQRRLYFGKNLGAVRQVVLRRTTNMDVKSLGDSADKLVNVLHCYGAGDGPAQIRTILRNQDSIDVYGERPGRFEDSSADTLAQLIESGNKHLAKVAQPEPQFVAHHVPVHELGEDIQLYDTVTVVDPKSGLVASVRILDEERQLTTSGEEVSLGLNCDLDNVIERIVKGQIPRPKPGGLPPEAPSDVRATSGYGYVQITWSGNASLFVVEHSGDGVTFSRLDQTPYRNYLHMGLEPGSTHYYRVTAVSSGGSSPPSSVVSAVVSRVPPEDLDQTPPATPIGLVAVSGASTEAPGITTAWVELSWTANAEIDLKDYYLRRRASEATAWEHVATVPKASTSHTDRVGVVPGTTYEYAIAASDVAGNVSPWSEAIEVSVPTGITIPGAPSGLTGSFEGVDAVATWDRPRIPDFAQTVVEVQVGGVTKRTSHETSTTFAYTQAMNVADNGTAKPSVTIKIAHENHKGDRSQWASVTLTNGVPTAPAGFAMSSADGMVALSIDAPGLPDFGYVEFQLALKLDYSDAKTVYRGRAFDALTPILAAARNYGRARLVDAFGQAGPWVTASVMGQPIPIHEPDTDPPAVPTGLTATGSAEMQADGGLLVQVELAWEAVADADLRAFAVRRRKGAGAWEQLATILATPGVAGAYIDAAGLATGVQYAYQVAAGDASGNWSAWSTSATVTVASDTTPPPAPTGLTGVFRDNDAIFAWDPCSAPDYKQSRIQIITGGTTKRTGRVDGTTFVYSLAMNRADHTTPQPKVTCRVAHEDRYGNVSGWTTVTATKPAPAAPTGLTMFSTLTMIQMGCDVPDGTEVDSVEFQLATTSNYSDAIPVYRGSTYQGIMAPIRATGTNYGRVRFLDIFGQAGSWATGSCTAKLIGKDDMQGAIFQITPSSTPAPSSGALEQLWDADTGTGPMFGSAPTIEFEYPIAELTDLVRFFVDRSCTYYVQAYNEQAGAWVDVVGSATAKVAAAGGQWHVRQFDGGKMVAARQLRIIFDRALRLTELKFWRSVIADEILVGAIKAWQIDTESIFIGDLGDGDSIPRTIDEDEAYFPFDGGLASTRGIQPTFTRSSAAVNPDTGATVAANEPRFVEGKFGKAVLVEEATTNLVANPFFEGTYSSGLAPYWAKYGSPSVSENTDVTYTRNGNKSQRIVAAGSAQGVRSQGLTITSEVTYTATCLIYIVSGRVKFDCKFGTSWVAVVSPEGHTGWWEPSITRVADGTAGSFYVYSYEPAEFYVDAAQYEKKPYVTSFTEGTRAGETLSIPINGTLNPQEGTVECWAYVDVDQFAGLSVMDRWRPVWTTGKGGLVGTYALYYYQLSQCLEYKIYGSDAAGIVKLPIRHIATGWHHFGCTWDAQGMALRVDGALIGMQATPKLADNFYFDDIYIGNYGPIAQRQLNFPISNLRLHRRALTDEEIAAHAQAANAPYDPRALSGPIDADVRPVRLMDNQIWLDRTGLKMQNAGVPNVMMHLDANRLGFWDPHGDPSIGIGDVADMATALGSDMEYGLLLAQGEIRATEAVIRKSLAQGLVGQKHVEDGSVTLKKLSDLLSVTIPDRFQLHTGKTLEGENKLTNPGFETGSLTGWTGTGTVVSSPVHSGSYAVSKANIYQDTPASPGQVWVGQAWVRDQSLDQEYVTLQFLNSSKSVLSTVNSPTESGASWQLLRAIGVAPANTAYARLLIKSVGTNTIHRFDDCLLAQGGVSSTYVTFASATISQTEACEQIKVNTEIDNPAGATIYTRVLVNGANKLEVSGAVNPVTASLTLDVRSIAGNITVQVQAKTSGSGAAWTKAEIMTNQRLPLRGAPPRYAVTSSTESSCGTTCEAACQATCQTTCQSDCQDTCQESCQTTCQSTCEQTSQGGGCWVAGTPVTIYLPESETAMEIPVEQLEPGMRMPYYDPATDTLAITECLSNQRSHTHTVFVAEVEGGYTLEMTGEQPMDVLRAHLVTGQTMWHRVQARYLRAGDKLIRPFDKTMHTVLSVREESRARTWVWNPKTAARAYIAHGFADAISKT